MTKKRSSMTKKLSDMGRADTAPPVDLRTAAPLLPEPPPSSLRSAFLVLPRQDTTASLVTNSSQGTQSRELRPPPAFLRCRVPSPPAAKKSSPNGHQATPSSSTVCDSQASNAWGTNSPLPPLQATFASVQRPFASSFVTAADRRGHFASLREKQQLIMSMGPEYLRGHHASTTATDRVDQHLELEDCGDHTHLGGSRCSEPRTDAKMPQAAQQQHPHHQQQLGVGWKQRVASLLFLDKINYKNVCVWLIAFPYVPILAFALALTVNCVMFVFFNVIAPLLEDDFEDSSPHPSLSTVVTADSGASGATFNQSDVWNVAGALLSGASGLLPSFHLLYTVATMLTHVGVFIGCATIGYKILSVLIDAMVDCCLMVTDPKTKEGVLYYAMLSDLRVISCQKYRWLLWTVMFGMGVSAFAALLLVGYSSLWGLQVAWKDTDRYAFDIVVATTLFQVIWLVVSWCCLKDGTEDGVTAWWARMIPRVRRRGVYVVFVLVFLLCTADEGTRVGVTRFAEAMLYLNLIHCVLCGIVKLTLFLVKVIRSFQALAKHRTVRKLAALFILPWLVPFGLTALFFDKICVLIQIPPFLLLLTSLVSFLQRDASTVVLRAHDRQHHHQHQHHNHGGGGGPHRASVTVTEVVHVPSLVDLALKLYLCNSKPRARRMPHYHAGLLVRGGLRATLILLSINVMIIGVIIGLQQSPVFHAPSTTKCEVDGPNGIQLYSRALQAKLYGLEHAVARLGAVDPNTLIYEPDPRLYDRRRYDGICERRWHDWLTAGDLAWFSLAAYMPRSSTDLDNLVKFYRKHRHDASEWALIGQPVKQQRVSGPTFHHFHNSKHNITVISIRGTDVGSAKDFMQNILTFSESAIFQFLSYCIPGSGFLPESVIIDIIYLSSQVDRFVLGKRAAQASSPHYFMAVENYLESYLQDNPGTRVILTGHSLGGFLAQVVAARMRVYGVAFAAPGIFMTQRKYDIPADAIDAYTTNIVASNDLVDLLGRHTGTLHHIQCEHRRSDTCHSIEMHMIRMWTMCASIRALGSVNGTYVVAPSLHEAVMLYAEELFRTARK